MYIAPCLLASIGPMDREANCDPLFSCTSSHTHTLHATLDREHSMALYLQALQDGMFMFLSKRYITYTGIQL